MSAETRPTAAGPDHAGSWPAGGLERVEVCPVCGNAGRDRLYDRLTDRVFGCAPGEWTLYRCTGCRSAYVDPRPTPESIGLAYQSYFTHEASPEPPASSGSPLGYLKAAIRNDYLKARFGVALQPSLPLGRLASYLMPVRCLEWDRSLRHLSLPRPNAKLLDIGCGNGGFVRAARALGWDAEGIDPDPKAVAAARKLGLSVTEGGFPHTGHADGKFDAVTLSHVIEHVHEPVLALREINRILRPGGIVWVATPNVDSAGHHLFHSDWRGLEPPRHLTVFNASSLKRACEQAGFVDVVLRRPPPVAAWYFLASQRIVERGDPMRLEGAKLPAPLRWRARWADLKATLRPEVAEEVAVTATKP